MAVDVLVAAKAGDEAHRACPHKGAGECGSGVGVVRAVDNECGSVADYALATAWPYDIGEAVCDG